MQPEYSDMKFYVKSTECGTDSCLAPYVLLSDLQETADKGAADTRWGREAIGEYNCCWIVLRYRIRINRLPSWKEEFTIRTWTLGAKKLFFNREFEIYDGAGELIGQATSIWILADKNTHSPVYPHKLEDLPQNMAQSDRFTLGESCPKLKIPSVDGFDRVPDIIKFADYSELDHNHHVNNTRYLAWIYDALYKLGYDIFGVKDIVISYVSEVKAGQKVDIYVEKQDDGFVVSGYRDDGSGVFTSEIKLCI